MHDLNDVTSPQTVESMTAAMRDPHNGPRQQELAAAALSAGEGTEEWFAAECALAETFH